MHVYKHENQNLSFTVHRGVNTKYYTESLRRRRPPGGKPVEMLAVLTVLTLVPTWSDGLVLKKCELKSQLEAAFSELQRDKAEDIIAKLTCTVEQISGFSSSLETITDQFDTRTLIITPFLYGHDEEYLPGMGELPLTSMVTNGENEDYIFPENVVVTEESIQDVGQAKKRRDAPSTDEVGGSWMSGDGSGEESEETQENNGLEETTLGDIFQETVEPHRLPDPTYVNGDTYEMLFGPTDLPPETTTESTDIYYDTYEMLFGPTDLPPETTTESTDIYYDTYEMLFGPTDTPMDSLLDRPLDTTLPPETKTRSKHRSEDQTVRYGIFQLSDIACNSGSSESLNLCGLDCSALTDDDITDDIACLMTLDEKVTAMTFPQACLAVEPSRYLAECD